MLPPTFTPNVINDFLTPDAVKDFLTKRKNFRRAANSKSGSSANPDLVAPPSGEWLGACKECRACGDGQEITYCLSFKPCGTVEGSGSIPEGDFIVKGVYNMAKGTVAWRQSPSSSSCCEHESKLTAEFVGELTLPLNPNWPSHQGGICGSFLTTSGDYYGVELDGAEIQSSCGNLPEPLPTLLTGGACTSKGAATPLGFHSKQSNFSHTMETSQRQKSK
eukprot:gnl/MRDRNA2_/MRDRNA2_29351_c1_seq2.p1 gnl/MRDRNA2_/MRDRNA2_29351_c1~~gnl/MRDRNA2_/MRDRNA2_29351_c1_seq2.p1  ORF type:complete len:258 (-),score=44.23 gnl/MRDRNA2_/MRDRNA2_29351_c1_seq2:219-878(-)